MPGVRCGVYGCTSVYPNKNKEKITMHRFPKISNFVSLTLRNEWVRRCSKGDEFNPKHSRICCKHFVETDYEKDLQNEMLGLPLRKILKKTAVPSIGLKRNFELPKTIESTIRHERKEIIDDILSRAKDNRTYDKAERNLISLNTSSSCAIENTNNIDEEYEHLLKEYYILKSEFRSEYKQMQEKLKKEVK